MNRLYDTKPADWNWEAAYPVGNGRLGAMIFGEAQMEHYQINEESVWSGVQTERENPDARASLERVRELIFAGKIPEAEPGHRHISHLYGLYPSSQIHRERTPRLAEAAKVTLQRRLASGGGHTGWSRAWIIGMYARLWEGDEAYRNLILLLQKSTLGNLFDYHPPFQIDGNFGAAAGIGEMLLQSDRRPGHKSNRVYLLPALPAAWKSGRIEGIRARGGGIFDLSWREGHLTGFTVRTEREKYEARAVYRGCEMRVEAVRGREKKYCVNENNVIEYSQG